MTGHCFFNLLGFALKNHGMFGRFYSVFFETYEMNSDLHFENIHSHSTSPICNIAVCSSKNAQVPTPHNKVVCTKGNLEFLHDSICSCHCILLLHNSLSSRAMQWNFAAADSFSSSAQWHPVRLRSSLY